jgi:hypothetical protein
MNFRLTFWKLIVSILIGGLSNFIFMNINGGCRGIYCYYPAFISYKFLFIFVILLIYIVWSLLQVKTKVNRKLKK